MNKNNIPRGVVAVVVWNFDFLMMELKKIVDVSTIKKTAVRSHKNFFCVTKSIVQSRFLMVHV